MEIPLAIKYESTYGVGLLEVEDPVCGSAIILSENNCPSLTGQARTPTKRIDKQEDRVRVESDIRFRSNDPVPRHIGE
jgi:hypothetical protein